MKILHVISSLDPNYGGPVSALSGFVRAQKQGGLVIDVAHSFVRGEDSTAIDTLRAAQVNVSSLGPAVSPWRWHPAMNARIKKLVEQADIVHVHGVWEAIQFYALRAAVAQHKPFVFRPCGMLDAWSFKQKRFKKTLYFRQMLARFFDEKSAVHFTSAAEYAGSKLLIGMALPFIEPLGVDPPILDSASKTAFFRRFPELEQRPYLIFLGRLVPKKGLDLLIKAAARLDLAPDWRLLLAGPVDRHYQQDLESLAHELGILQRIVFSGALHDGEKYAALSGAQLFVLPSQQENFGVAVVEALGVGTPVVISKAVDIYPEIVAARLGTAVDLSVEQLTQAIKSWLIDKSSLKRVRQEGPVFVQQHYDWQTIAARWLKRYKKLQE